jgi:meiosis arrest female protein 1
MPIFLFAFIIKANLFQVEEIFESPICSIHCPEGSEFYVTALDSAGLPNVVLQLKGLAPQVHSLLQAHNGSMPLMR